MAGSVAWSLPDDYRLQSQHVRRCRAGSARPAAQGWWGSSRCRRRQVGLEGLAGAIGVVRRQFERGACMAGEVGDEAGRGQVHALARRCTTVPIGAKRAYLLSLAAITCHGRTRTERAPCARASTRTEHARPRRLRTSRAPAMLATAAAQGDAFGPSRRSARSLSQSDRLLASAWSAQTGHVSVSGRVVCATRRP